MTYSSGSGRKEDSSFVEEKEGFEFEIFEKNRRSSSLIQGRLTSRCGRTRESKRCLCE